MALALYRIHETGIFAYDLVDFLCVNVGIYIYISFRANVGKYILF